jgi:hypothetical protein
MEENMKNIEEQPKQTEFGSRFNYLDSLVSDAEQYSSRIMESLYRFIPRPVETIDVAKTGSSKGEYVLGEIDRNLARLDLVNSTLRECVSILSNLV